MNKILLLASFLSFNLFAAEAQFGRVVDLKGDGFISYNGKTREIKKGDTIEVGAEIVIEHHGQVSFTDNADHRYHLGNASSASVSATTVELRAGDLWFQSLNKNDSYKIKTANATVEYQGGEGILSYDSIKGKTQLMVINGIMKFANLRAADLNMSVTEGHFSFIDTAYDEGAPRDPTPVGEKTYRELVALFTGISPMDKNSAAIFKEHDKKEHAEHAEVATTEHGHEHAKKEVTKKVKREVASEKTDKETSVDSKMIEEYKNSILAQTSNKKTVTNKVSASKINSEKKAKVEKLTFHVYGKQGESSYAYTASDIAPKVAETKTATTTEKPSVTVEATKPSSRAPASVLDQEVPKEKEEAAKPAAPAVVSPYSKEYKNQYKESDKLLDDLKKL